MRGYPLIMLKKKEVSILTLYAHGTARSGLSSPFPPHPGPLDVPPVLLSLASSGSCLTVVVVLGGKVYINSK
jgi:hypothetical protein